MSDYYLLLRMATKDCHTCLMGLKVGYQCPYEYNSTEHLKKVPCEYWQPCDPDDWIRDRMIEVKKHNYFNNLEAE